MKKESQGSSCQDFSILPKTSCSSSHSQVGGVIKVERRQPWKEYTVILTAPNGLEFSYVDFLYTGGSPRMKISIFIDLFLGNNGQF